MTLSAEGLGRFRAKIQAGGLVALIVLGDSIARGDEALTPSRGFVSLVADAIQDRYASRVLVTNLSYGGATIKDARRMLRLLKGLENYDLLVLAVGVNDASAGVPVRAFRDTLRRIAITAESAGVDVLLVTPLEPTNADVGPYVRAMRESGLPLADVNAGWNDRPLANGINHPDSSGHKYYTDVVMAVVDGLAHSTDAPG